MEPSCSLSSLEVGEPLAGSAVAETHLWIALEHAPAWGPKGLEDSGLPEPVVGQLRTFTASHAHARVQLIRRPEHAASGTRGTTLFLGRSLPGQSSLWRRQLSRSEELLELDLTGFARGEAPAGFARVLAPLFLVCVHGKRDRCCAQRGMPVYSALADLCSTAARDSSSLARFDSSLARPRARFDVWQTTHLGGHRFAATLLVLPEGICYGRLEASEAEPLLAAHAEHAFYSIDRLRGRCAYASEAQAAEARLRAELGELGLDALTLLDTEQTADGTLVRFRHAVLGSEHTVRVMKTALPAFAQSCDAPPKRAEALIALTSR